MGLTNGKLQVVVSSKKVLVRVEDVEDSFMSWDGQTRSRRRRVKVYGHVLDEGQELALREARELARRSGLTFQVVDLSRRSAVWRALRWALGDRQAAAGGPDSWARRGDG